VARAREETGTGQGQLRLRPFRGLRYNAEQVGDVGAVTSPPYDVMDRPMIEELLQRHPRNVVRLILPRLVADPMHTEDPDAHAARQLHRWTEQQVLVPDKEPALYVYEYGTDVVRISGIIGALELRDPAELTILPHENVVPDIVADRLAMMSAAEANLEPILLVYDGAGQTGDILAAARSTAPLVDVVSDGTRHRLWSIKDSAEIERVQQLIGPHQALIADGHHRYATYLELRGLHRSVADAAGPWDCGLALLIDSSQYPLHLGAIHRTLSDVSLDSLFEPPGYALGAHRPSGADAAALCTQTRRLVLTDGVAARTLTSSVPAIDAVTDAELLHSQVLPAWNVSDNHLSYHHTAEQAVRAAQLDGGVAVLVHPPRLEQVMQSARAGTMLPRKSTSFGPKPRSGVVMRRFADEP
jgi:uncharacterized protein (DUF1015 family)